ncbi:esterase FrsA [Veronia pacifica]|uniref:Esterase FrsA n=1 Tax=Veronia pacifica TaxID=1080227 RepID=A0A1C3EFC8_9GAMM|nr:hypothetical protein A8L45_14855 [Veronia pacifica]
MSEAYTENLSETLFNNYRHARETSVIVGTDKKHVGKVSQAIDGISKTGWYRVLRRPQWIWQGVDPIEMEATLAKIAASNNQRSDDMLLDTVVGYRPGNWIYEWSTVAMSYQKKAQLCYEAGEKKRAAELWMKASTHFSIAAYPHLKGDSLAAQAEILAKQAFTLATENLPTKVKTIEFTHQGKPVKGMLYLPHTVSPLPVVIISGGLETLQTELWQVFTDYFAEQDVALLTLDMPSVGYCSDHQLSQDSSCLHQAMLQHLRKVPWVDHNRVGFLGLRFGGNAAVRMAFVEPDRVKACVSLGGIVHSVLNDQKKLSAVPSMHLDMLASRLGRRLVTGTLLTSLRALSLKNQGLLAGRRTQVPVLAISLKNDPVCPESDNRLIATYSQGGKAITLPNKPLHDGYHSAMQETVQWFAKHL